MAGEAIKRGPHQVIFAVSPLPAGGLVVLLGVSKESWEYMRDGRTHNFDLTRLGLPIQVVMFGAETQAEALAHIEKWNKEVGIQELRDMRDVDWSIPPKKDPNQN